MATITVKDGTTMERRVFLGTIAGASLGVFSESSIAEIARAQVSVQSSAHFAGALRSRPLR
jgi:hypothetical protein